MIELRTLTTVTLAALLMLPLGAGSISEASSTAKQKKTRVHKQATAPKPVYRWRPADPSFDQNGRLYKPPPGLPCPIDLGYGRWTSCMWDR